MGCLTNVPDDSEWERFEYVEPEMGVDFHRSFMRRTALKLSASPRLPMRA